MITWMFNNMQNCTNRLSGRYENILWAVKNLDDYVFHLDDVRIANPIYIEGKKKSGRFYINGKRLYDRILIKRKK